MADVLITAGQSLSQNVSEGGLCSTMTKLANEANGKETMCADCDIRLMKTEFRGGPSIIASVPQNGEKCETIELMRSRLL